MKSIARNCCSILLAILGIAGPAQLSLEALPALPTPVAAMPKAPRTPMLKTAVVVRTPVIKVKEQAIQVWLTSNARTYRYEFSGRALYHGQPCANANIELRMESRDGVKIHTARTAADGSYRVPVQIVGAPDQTMDWEINAVHDANNETLRTSLTGHQILTAETAIQIYHPLQFTEI